MSRLHECHSTEKLSLKQKQDLDTFLVLASKELSAAGHVYAVLKFIAWVQDGSKPTPHVVKDEILPCLKDMIYFDEEGWGAVRTYVHVTTKETDASLGIDLASLGTGHSGPRAKGLVSLTKIAASIGTASGDDTADAAEGSPVVVHPLLVSKQLSKRPRSLGGVDNKARKKPKHDSAKDVVSTKRGERKQVLSREHTSEELRHDGSESEVETPDSDYADDGFVVDDEVLEFESDVDSEDIPNDYQYE